MKRSIIRIDETKCDGCGLCVPACHEGAIKIIDGKARLVGDSLCDGLGACLGECPRGAITVEEREAGEYNEVEALENIMKEGPEALKAHLKHLADHGQEVYLKQAQEFLHKKEAQKPMACGCPGTMAQTIQRAPVSVADQPGAPVASQLQQWPVQLKLLNPHAPYFKDAELVVAADCVAFAYGDFHRRFLKGKVLVVFCPKLDEGLEEYIDKLSAIFQLNNIRSITLCRMEVPCCGGTGRIVEEALKRSGKNIIIKEYTISLRGEII
jgi:NAD-dependent dihydropyrimidine dehydrogenase PreA subunit